MLNRPFFMSAKFSEYIYTNIITSFTQQGKQGLFIDYLKRIKDDPDFSDSLKRAIIEACGVRNVVAAGQTIRDYFITFNSVSDMKITCLRALGELGGDGYLGSLSWGSTMRTGGCGPWRQKVRLAARRASLLRICETRCMMRTIT